MSERQKQEIPPRPIGTRVLIKVERVEHKTSGGIFIPQNALETEKVTKEKGTVVALGESAFKGYEPAWVSVGEKVQFLRHAGSLFTVNDEDYRIVNDVDLIGGEWTEEEWEAIKNNNKEANH